MYGPWLFYYQQCRERFLVRLQMYLDVKRTGSDLLTEYRMRVVSLGDG